MYYAPNRGTSCGGRQRWWSARSGTRNPKPEARNPKPGTRNPKHETRTPNPESRIPKCVSGCAQGYELRGASALVERAQRSALVCVAGRGGGRHQSQDPVD